MKVEWTYELPLVGDDLPNGREVPLFWDGSGVWLPYLQFQHPRHERRDPARRGYAVTVLRLTPDGTRASSATFAVSETLLPQQWSFLEVGRRLLLHVGTFHSLPPGERIMTLPHADAGDRTGPGVFVLRGDELVFLNALDATLCCFDVATLAPRWALPLENQKPYRAGPVVARGDDLLCFGRDALNRIASKTGTVIEQTRFPRAERLFPPIEFEGDLLYAYTNGSTGGLLRVGRESPEIVWRCRTPGTVRASRGTFPVVDGTAILPVNDGSSIVAVDLRSGEQRWKFRAQWLYTPMHVHDDSILFGTSGGNRGHHLRRHHARTGKALWEVEMAGGCTSWAWFHGDIIAADWAGNLRRVRISDGAVIDQLALGHPIEATPLVCGRHIGVLRWPSGGARPSFVFVGGNAS